MLAKLVETFPASVRVEKGFRVVDTPATEILMRVDSNDKRKFTGLRMTLNIRGYIWIQNRLVQIYDFIFNSDHDHTRTLSLKVPLTSDAEVKSAVASLGEIIESL